MLIKESTHEIYGPNSAASEIDTYLVDSTDWNQFASSILFKMVCGHCEYPLNISRGFLPYSAAFHFTSKNIFF